MTWPEHPCYLNGEFQPLGQARISVLDRGFIFGDGIYEVVPVYFRKPLRFEQHMARFERSLRETGMSCPLDRAAWRSVLDRLVAGCGAEHQFVYWQVTRGVAKRDFAFPADTPPTVFAMTSPLVRPDEALRRDGLRLVSRADERWLRCDIKSTSLLGAVLARQFAAEQGMDEVLQHRDGYLTEGSASNIWVVRDGRVIGVPRDNRILEGIRYGFMTELCAARGIPFETRPVPVAEVCEADELLLTGATREVLPIVQLDGRPVGRGAGAGRPGPVYAALRAAYDEAVDALKE